jgi:hypothetical protein
MIKFWIGVASRDHVLIGKMGGFCQLCHGKSTPLRRLSCGDRIVYYSPRERMDGGYPVQSFTALGVILDGNPRQVDLGGDFRPFRRDVSFRSANDAPIRPLLSRLSFTRGRASWGAIFRTGVFEVTPDDYGLIAEAMGVFDEDVNQINPGLLADQS